MTVYVSKNGERFFNVTNDPNYGQIILKDLVDGGFQFLSAEYVDKGTVAKLIETINTLTLREKLELTNRLLVHWHQEPISVQKSFDEYFSYHKGDDDYGQEDFLEEFLYGGECVLDGLQQVYSKISSFKDFNLVLSYLNQTLDPKHWKSWLLRGYNQGELIFAWHFDPDNKFSFNGHIVKDDGLNDYLGETTQEALTAVIYDNFIRIEECDEASMSVDGLVRDVAGYTVRRASIVNSSDQYVNKYMLEMYNAIPARISVKYFPVKANRQVKIEK